MTLYEYKMLTEEGQWDTVLSIGKKEVKCSDTLDW